MSEEPASPPSTSVAAADAATPREPEAVLAQEESGYDSDQTPRSNPGDPGGCGSSPGSSRSSINSGSDKQSVDRTDNGESVTSSIYFIFAQVCFPSLLTNTFVHPNIKLSGRIVFRIALCNSRTIFLPPLIIKVQLSKDYRVHCNFPLKVRRQNLSYFKFTLLSSLQFPWWI